MSLVLRMSLFRRLWILLAVDGRISVITFHSLEDRLTKQLFKEASTVDVPKGLPFIPEDLQPKVALG